MAQKENGYFKGRHYTEYVDEIKQFKREKKLLEAELLLLSLIDVIEQDSKSTGHCSPPWYYEQLAIIYRKQAKFADEIFICERYCKAKNNRPEYVFPFLERIEKAKILGNCKS